MHQGDRTPRRELDRAVACVATRQHGVFTLAQVMRAGGTRGMVSARVRTGRWIRAHHGVFVVAGSPRSWLQSLMAAAFAWGSGAAVSHAAAAALWTFPGLEEQSIEGTVPRCRRRSGPGVVHHADLAPREIVRVGVIPVTDPCRTLIDVAGIAARDVLEEALDDALRRRLVTVAKLRRRLGVEPWQGKAGVPMLRALLDERDGGGVPQSVLETRVLRALRAMGLPPPVCQHLVRDGTAVVAIADFAYPRERILVEADGARWHSGRRRWRLDLARRNRLTMLGWQVFHVTSDDLKPGSAALRAVGAAWQAARGIR